VFQCSARLVPAQGWQSRQTALSEENHNILECENGVRRLLAAVPEEEEGAAGGGGEGGGGGGGVDPAARLESLKSLADGLLIDVFAVEPAWQIIGRFRYSFPRRALTLCPQLCMGIQPDARFPARSADALPATLYGHFNQAIYRNRHITSRHWMSYRIREDGPKCVG
jgi:hypothetical protein